MKGAFLFCPTALLPASPVASHSCTAGILLSIFDASTLPSKEQEDEVCDATKPIVAMQLIS